MNSEEKMRNIQKIYFCGFKKRGFTLVEMMIATVILLIMLSSGYLILFSGQEAWHTTETSIRVQESLRQTLDRVSKELRESGSNSVGTMQVTITDNTGTNGSDIINFSIPVICEAGGSIIDANGDVTSWGAPARWGCTDIACMDPDGDDDCDYGSIQYLIDGSNRLVRRVLDSGAVVIRTDIFAQNVTDFQAVLSVDQNIVTLTATASLKGNTNRTITSTKSLDVQLRNRG